MRAEFSNNFEKKSASKWPLENTEKNNINSNLKSQLNIL